MADLVHVQRGWGLNATWWLTIPFRPVGFRVVRRRPLQKMFARRPFDYPLDARPCRRLVWTSDALHLPTTCLLSPRSPVEARAWSSPVEELLRRARPVASHEKMLIEDLTKEEGAAFLATLEA